jgi:hypothetical protein
MIFEISGVKYVNQIYGEWARLAAFNTISKLVKSWWIKILRIDCRKWPVPKPHQLNNRYLLFLIRKLILTWRSLMTVHGPP